MLKILIYAASNMSEERIVEADSLESVINDLRNGNISIENLINKHASWLCKVDNHITKPANFIITLLSEEEKKNNKYDIIVCIYDFYME